MYLHINFTKNERETAKVIVVHKRIQLYVCTTIESALTILSLQFSLSFLFLSHFELKPVLHFLKKKHPFVLMHYNSTSETFFFFQNHNQHTIQLSFDYAHLYVYTVNVVCTWLGVGSYRLL